MTCDTAFVVVLLLLIVSMTMNFYVVLRWALRKVTETIAAIEEVESGS